jgi:hypothetical protein
VVGRKIGLERVKMEKIKAVKQEEDCNFKLKGIF